jgi:hypothetical protein
VIIIRAPTGKLVGFFVRAPTGKSVLTLFFRRLKPSVISSFLGTDAFRRRSMISFGTDGFSRRSNKKAGLDIQVRLQIIYKIKLI